VSRSAIRFIIVTRPAASVSSTASAVLRSAAA
jgi:hypothetical protein